MDIPNRVLRAALARWYFTKTIPSTPPKHPLWQAPFVFANDGEPTMHERAVMAGRLWLRNMDGLFTRTLVIYNTEEPWTYVFSRSVTLGMHGKSYGPINEAYAGSTLPMLHLSSIRFGELGASEGIG